MNTYNTMSLLTEKSLSDLLAECQRKMAEYRSGRTTDSSSCIEIVRRAVRGNSSEAQGILLDCISKSIIVRKCQKDYPELLQEVEDIVQEVNILLLKKFNNQQEPFRVASFAEYCSFVNVTLRNFVFNLKRQQQRVPSTTFIPDDNEQHKQQGAAALTIPSPADEVERRLLWQQILSKLPNPQAREVFERYYSIGESTAEIAKIMQIDTLAVTKFRQQALTAIRRSVLGY